jgi:hypothetical protein
MFIGHFAIGFASKRWAPETSLGVLLAAAQGPDLLWPIFLLAGVEAVRIAPGDTAMTPLEFVRYPWSQSMLMVGVWAALAAIVARLAPARDARAGRWLPAGLAAALAAIYAASVLAPPPPSVAAIAWTSIAGGLLFLAWAAWADRHRTKAV